MEYNLKTRIYLEMNLSKNLILQLDKNISNKIFKVLRLKEGDRVVVFNNKDGEWLGRCLRKNDKRGSILCEKIIKKDKVEKGPWLIFSPIKFGRIEWLVEKATECGVERLLPSLMQRTIVRNINLKKLVSHSVSASEQSGRISIPDVNSLKSLEDHIEFSINNNKNILFCDESISSPSINECLNAINPSNVAILIGPEGGFNDEERKYLRKVRNLMACSLGPRIFRADTAALVALTIVQMR